MATLGGRDVTGGKWRSCSALTIPIPSGSGVRAAAKRRCGLIESDQMVSRRRERLPPFSLVFFPSCS